MEEKFVNLVNRYVGERLKELRLLRGLSQTELGRELGLTFQQIQKYEKGLNNINAGRLYHIARVLQVPLLYFYDGLDTYEPVALPEGREEWLKLTAAAANLRNPKLREVIKSLILDARRMEQHLYGDEHEEHT